MKILALKIIVLVVFIGCSVRADETVRVLEFNGFKDVEFLRIENENVFYNHKDGAGKININSVPSELRDKLIRKLPKVDMAEKARAESKKKVENIKRLFASERGGEMLCEVIQVFNDGVLVLPYSFTPNSKEAEGKISISREEPCVIVCDPAGMYDGKKTRIKVYLMGTHKYKTTNDVQKTVLKFGVNLKESFAAFIKEIGLADQAGDLLDD
jgi:hypothetical protein